jgi:hypothetical protein
MHDYIDWLLTDAYLGQQSVNRCVNWLTFGLLIGALLVYFGA